MEKKMNEKWLPHIIAAGAFVVLIALGLACATTQSVPVTYTEPARLNMSGIKTIAVESNSDQVASEISHRLSGKFTVASPVELQEYIAWKGNGEFQAKAIEVKATDLGKEYTDNVARADIKYGNKVIKTSGVVKDIDQTSSGVYFVSLDAGNKNVIALYFIPSEASKIPALNKGQTITVVGECFGRNLPDSSDTGKILQLLGGVQPVNVVKVRFPVAGYTGPIDAVVSVRRDFQAQDTHETKQVIQNYTDSAGKIRSRTVDVTVYYRVGTLSLNYQIMRSRDFTIIGVGVKSQTSNKYSSEYGDLPGSSDIAARLTGPFVELAGEMVPTERTISITLQKEENNKNAKKEMAEAEKFVKAKDYKNAVSTYGNIYAKYNNFAAGYNHAVLMEATEGTAAAVELMAALAAQTNADLAKTTLAEMQERNKANQQVMQQSK